MKVINWLEVIDQKVVNNTNVLIESTQSTMRLHSQPRPQGFSPGDEVASFSDALAVLLIWRKISEIF